jgi:hypothetical protein
MDKLRAVLLEKYGGDLLAPTKSKRLDGIPEADSSERRLMRSKMWGSFLKFKPNKS